MKPIIITNNNYKHKRKRTQKLLSETPEYKLAQGYLIIRKPDGQLIRGRVALDSQSNASYSHPSISTNRLRHPYEVSNAIGVGGKPISLGDPLRLTIIKNGKSVNIDTTGGHEHLFKSGIVAILSAQHMKMLGISVDACLQEDEHKDIVFKSDNS